MRKTQTLVRAQEESPEEAPGAWGLKEDEGQQEDRQEPVPCEDLVGEEGTVAGRQKSKRQGVVPGPDAAGHLVFILRTAGGYRSFEHRAARSKGRGSRTPDVIMNEKVTESVFSKPILNLSLGNVFKLKTKEEITFSNPMKITHLLEGCFPHAILWYLPEVDMRKKGKMEKENDCFNIVPLYQKALKKTITDTPMPTSRFSQG